jgi:hypothetical protein
MDAVAGRQFRRRAVLGNRCQSYLCLEIDDRRAASEPFDGQSKYIASSAGRLDDEWSGRIYLEFSPQP